MIKGFFVAGFSMFCKSYHNDFPTAKNSVIANESSLA